jgi:HEAT repeat protein
MRIALRYLVSLLLTAPAVPAGAQAPVPNQAPAPDRAQAPPAAQTQSRPRRGERASTSAHADPADQLQSSNRDEIASAIATIRRTPRPADIAALARRIDHGLPPPLLTAAVDALVAVGRSASRALAALATHRRPAVRQRVAEGLVAARAPEARRVLRELLDDPNAAVRASAASGLGDLGPQGALADLLLAARRGLPEAATVVASSVRPHQVRSVLLELDTDSLESLLPVLRGIATRTDLPARARIPIVGAIKAFDNATSRRFLQQLVDSLPEDDGVREVAAEATTDDQEVSRSEEGAS